MKVMAIMYHSIFKEKQSYSLLPLSTVSYQLVDRTSFLLF